MKKLLLILAVVVIGWIALKSLGKEDSPPARPVASLPSNAPPAIPQKEATAGSALNKAFPDGSGDFKVVFTQEKDGFSQADLTKAGTRVATLSVSDTAANPAARDKFKTATRKISGYPAAPVGSQGTAVLVGDRYQVQVRSLQPSFTTQDREAWLAKFDLARLAR